MSAQWVELELISRRTVRVQVNVTAPDDLQGLSMSEIVRDASDVHLEELQKFVRVIGSCDEPQIESVALGAKDRL